MHVYPKRITCYTTRLEAFFAVAPFGPRRYGMSTGEPTEPAVYAAAEAAYKSPAGGDA